MYSASCQDPFMKKTRRDFELDKVINNG